MVQFESIKNKFLYETTLHVTCTAFKSLMEWSNAQLVSVPITAIIFELFQSSYLHAAIYHEPKYYKTFDLPLWT